MILSFQFATKVAPMLFAIIIIKINKQCSIYEFIFFLQRRNSGNNTNTLIPSIYICSGITWNKLVFEHYKSNSVFEIQY